MPLPSVPVRRRATSPGLRTQQAAACHAPDVLTPADRYAELFVAVQRGRIFPDSKTFVDCSPRRDPAEILAAYRADCAQPGFDLRAFVDANFVLRQPTQEAYVSVPGQPLCAHIDALWPVLTRQPLDHPPHSSLLQLPLPYVVPGGRFRELYYWDSYFTMLGLAASGETERLHDMVGNFAYLIDTYGHVPNGTRTYYLGRSQPPLFVCMVELAEALGHVHAADYLSQLRAEHGWWMQGAEGLAPGQAAQRVVRMPDGAALNRYWDARDTPREEAWLEDVTTAQASGREPAEVYRHLRAAAESGWDFSTRWLGEPDDCAAGADGGHAAEGTQRATHRAASDAASLQRICTTDLLPVDLNAFLYRLERCIARLSAQAGDTAAAQDFSQQAQSRQRAMQTLMWNAERGAFFDHDWRLGRQRRGLTAAALTPLFVGLADAQQAQVLAATVTQRLLAPGGLSTTECESDQQWDQPNGWAALQWMAVRGLADYGQHALAGNIAQRWLATVAAVYEREGKLVEKYALRRTAHDQSAGGGGGEYPLQDGFGWTNGVTRALMAAHPQHSAHGCVGRSAQPLHR
ncbi:trehalase family glycosidase [Variovorax ginsengisoli]|uniref:Alpha,alpha-trehalase n=1 Tax=Variovorax ginsengisoli TaxID=363844 RepID=A0ABT9S5I4_9BURK|nr:trehalase family glycosidase [Variovorax ginsengisoli]MDP9899619.1 alpha,alpha-trehalase [Variovorax ginsengisoli]